MAREPEVVRGGSKCNTGGSSGDDIGDSGDIGGGRSCDRKGCGSVASGLPGAKCARWRGEEPRAGNIVRG